MMKKYTKIINHLMTLLEDHPPHSGARVVAMIIGKNKNISYGFNREKTHPLQKKFSKNSDAIFLHAEIDSIINFLKRNKKEELIDSTMFVARLKYIGRDKKKYECGIAKPCQGCQKAIESYSIGKVVYTLDRTGGVDTLF